MEQQQKKHAWRSTRAITSTMLGLLLLATELPSTGGIIEGPPHFGMWRCGPFLFYPGPFFMVVGVATVSIGCVLFGIVRGNALEIVGWALLGIHLLFVLMG
jgi:hypothetical protein